MSETNLARSAGSDAPGGGSDEKLGMLFQTLVDYVSFFERYVCIYVYLRTTKYF